MSNGFNVTIKNAWKRNKFGTFIFLIGTILFISGVILSIVKKIGFIPLSEYTDYVVLMIGIWLPLILSGIGILLQTHKVPMDTLEGFYTRYIEENEILIVECITAIVAIMLFFLSYPDGWYYPYIYIMVLPYVLCIFLLSINIISNVGKKDTEIESIIKELEETKTAIKEKEKFCDDSTAPEYITNFSNGLKRNIDELTSIMGALKISIDRGAKDIADTTTLVINKYRTDNEQLHKDVQNFKQRTEKDKNDSKERANERMIKSLMSTLSNIDELKQYKDKNAYTVGDIDKIKDDIFNILKSEDIEIINPSIGDDFDDKKCCAIQIIDTDKFPGKKVVDIKKIGCMYKSGKVIKYADVIVSKGKEIKEDVKAEDIKIGENVEIDDKGQLIPIKHTGENIEIKVDTKVDSKIEKDIKTTVNEKIETNIDTEEKKSNFISRLLASIFGNSKQKDEKDETIIDNKQPKKDETIIDSKQPKKDETIIDNKQPKKDETIIDNKQPKKDEK